MRASAKFAILLFIFGLAAAAARGDSLGDVIVQCAACHGADGIARSADVPHLAGQHELYLFNQLKAFRTGKRPHKEMRYMSRQLSDSEMEEIALHYARMPR
jgi:cytochrome c553